MNEDLKFDHKRKIGVIEFFRYMFSQCIDDNYDDFVVFCKFCTENLVNYVNYYNKNNFFLEIYLNDAKEIYNDFLEYYNHVKDRVTKLLPMSKQYISEGNYDYLIANFSIFDIIIIDYTCTLLTSKDKFKAFNELFELWDKQHYTNDAIFIEFVFQNINLKGIERNFKLETIITD